MEKIKIELPKDLAPLLAEKVAQAVRENYFFEAGRAIGTAISKKLEDDGFINRVADIVLEHLKTNENEYIKNVSSALTATLLDTTTTIAKATLEAVNKKVKDLGFIKIGDRF